MVGWVGFFYRKVFCDLLFAIEVPAEDINMNALNFLNLNALLLVWQKQAVNQCLQAQKVS